jgi:hypothetical protein
MGTASYIYTASHDPQSRSREVHFGTELEDPKVVARRGEGRGRGSVENVIHGLTWRLKARLAPGA